MMICECGTRAKRGAKFCVECGANVTANLASEAPIGTKTSSKKDRIARVAIDAGHTAYGAAKFVSEAAKEGVRSEMGKSIAMGAVAGALIALPLPVVGPALGASIGALFGAWKKF